MKKLLVLLLILSLAIIVFPQKTKISGDVKVAGKSRSVSTAGGGGTDFVNDTFTEAGTGTDNLNTSHTGELGATWTAHPHANYGGGPINIDKDNDRVWGPGTNLSYASGVPANADYTVCGDFYHVTTIAVNIAITGRTDTTADTMYLLRFNGGTIWELRKIVAGAATTLGSSTSELPSAGGAPKNACLVMVGDQISASINSGAATIGPITDTAISATGRVGVRSAGTSGASSGMHVDTVRAYQ